MYFWNAIYLIPKINTGQIVYFSKGSLGTNYLDNIGEKNRNGGSWSWPEPFGVWSEGKLATLFIPRPRDAFNTLTFDIQPYINSDIPTQSIAISVNGSPPDYFNLNSSEIQKIQIHFKKPVISPYLRIEFQLPNAKSPFELGRSTDDRKLSIGLISLSFHE